jgi:hypothetical protein
MKTFLPFFFLFFFVCTSAQAASLYMDPNVAELKRGDTIKVSVRLDTEENECVNAIDGVITYSENIQPVDTSRGNSIFSMWVEEPVIDKTKRTITFAGGIPNGYCGRIPGDPRLTNNIVDLLFQSPGLQVGTTESGNEASIDFNEKTQVYLNDGFGTLAQATFFGSKIQLSKDAGNVQLNPWQEAVVGDSVPPEKFSIALEQTKNAFSNDFFIVFNTTDKQSGIDHYEVIEEPLNSKNLFGWGALTAPWIEVKSPYVLEDQSLNSSIRVKAIDKAGNEYIATYVVDEEKRTLSKDNMYILGAGVVLLSVLIGLCVVAIVLHKRRKNTKESHELEITE